VKLLKVPLTILAIFLIQTMVLNRFESLRVIDLFLLLNIYFALNFEQLPCMAISVTSGLIQDTFSGGILGPNAFAKTTISYLISGLSSRLMLKHPLVILVLILVSTIVDLLLIRGLYMLFEMPVFPLSIRQIAWAAAINSIIGIVSFQIVDRFRVKKEYA
jgi:rod shape-determining protein MreD